MVQHLKLSRSQIDLIRDFRRPLIARWPGLAIYGYNHGIGAELANMFDKHSRIILDHDDQG